MKFMKIKNFKNIFQTTRFLGGLRVTLLSKGGQEYDGKITYIRAKS